MPSDFIYTYLTESQAAQLDATWTQSKKQYRLPNTLGALRELYRLAPSEDLQRQGKAKATQQQDLLARKQSQTFDTIPNLREYQAQDVHFLTQLPHAGIFNEQRTGKSPTVLTLLQKEKWERIVIVCPASLLLNWKKECETWVSSYPVQIAKGTKNQRQKIYTTCLPTSILILSYETLRSDLDTLTPTLPKTFALVADEAHRLRNYKSQQSKTLFKLGKQASKRLALTGTPSVNKGDDIYGILHFLYPTHYPSYWQFVARYFETWTTPWGTKEVKRYKREEELKEVLDLISTQRKRSEVMQWIPKKVYQTLEVEMDAKQRKAYNEMLDTFMVKEEGETIKVDAPSILAQLTRLRQICLSPSLLKLNAPSCKEKALLEWLDDNPNETVVIFSNFTSYLKEVSQKVKGSVLLHGEMSAEQKQKAVHYIQTGKSRVLFSNLISGGTGFTLDKAETVIFLDRDYVPSNNAQAEDRIIPTTLANNHTCTILDIVVADSIDSKILRLLQDKKSVIELINNYKSIKDVM